MVNGGRDMIGWLEGVGVTFKKEDLYTAGMELQPRGHKPTGDTGGLGPAGGAVLINHISKAFDKSKVQIHCGTRIVKVERKSHGFTATSEDGREFQGDAVVIASGGFGADLEKMARWYPDAVKHDGWYRYIGPESNRGDGLDIGFALGGRVQNFNAGGINCTPNFIKGLDAYMPPWLLYLNMHGERFVNELGPYAYFGPTVVAQPGSRVWGVFDARALAWAKEHPHDPDPYGLGFDMESNWQLDIINEQIKNGRIVKANSLAELARQTGMPAETLEHTIYKWNQGASQGQDPEYGKETDAILPLDSPPYYAADVRPHSVGITFPGLRIDHEARVLDKFTRPIPDVYAAGEAAGGLEHVVYPGGGYAIVSALVFGRIAGRNAAAVKATGGASEHPRHLSSRI